MSAGKLIRTLLISIISFASSSAHADSVVPDKLHSLKEQLAADTANADLLIEIGYLYFGQGDYASAQAVGSKLLDIARLKPELNTAELYGHFFMGGALNSPSKTSQQEAYRHLEQALNMAEQINDTKALVSIYNAFGIYYSTYREDVYMALYYHFKSLDLTRQLNDHRRYAILLSNIAANYVMRNDATGLIYGEEAYECAQALDDPLPLFYSSFSLAYLYIMKGDLPKALSLIHKIEGLTQSIGYVNVQDISLLYATYYLADKQPLKAMDICIELMNDPEGEANINLMLLYADALRATSQPRKALALLSQAYNHATENKENLSLDNIFRDYVEIYAEMGQLDSALYWSQRYIAHKDSLTVVDREMALQERRINHEIFQRDRKLDSQRIELLSTRSRLTLMISVTILLLLVIAGLSYYNHRQRKLYRAIVKQNTDFLQSENYMRGVIERHKAEAEAPEQAPKPTAKAEEDKTVAERNDSLMESINKLMIEDKIYVQSSLTLASLAERLKTNRTYISNAINQSTGQTFSQMLTHYRITEAIRLISDLDANIPIKQIASACGFESLSSFYSAFSSTTGLTPARYRSQLIGSRKQSKA